MAHRSSIRPHQPSSKIANLEHSCTSTLTEPFITRQHAEAAAIEAYSQAQPMHRSIRPQRRRSQQEGSHFENARLGHRESGKKPSTISGKPSRARLQKRNMPSMPQLKHKEVVVTQERAAILPSSSPAANSGLPTVPSSARNTRYTPSMTADNGSPAPRHTLLGRRSSLMMLPNFDKSREGAHARSPARTLGDRDLSGWPEAVMTHGSSKQPATREGSADVGLARDRALYDFQRQSRLRGRKSFILAPFQRRRATASPAAARDTFLPPYNYAGCGENVIPSTPEPQLTVPAPLATKAMSRKVSDHIKGRFRKIFCRVSQLSDGLPPQHMEAKTNHYPLKQCTDQGSASATNIKEEHWPESEYHPFQSSVVQNEDKGDSPFLHTIPSPDAMNYDRARSQVSVDQISTARSRVTSWTNSTVTGTATSRMPSEAAGPNERGLMKRSGSLAALRRTGSLLSRSFRNPTRRTSRDQVQSLDEDVDLCPALNNPIERSQIEGEIPTPLDCGSLPRLRACSALSDLPSQQQFRPTLRTVTPDDGLPSNEILSPVAEILSPIQPCREQIMKRLERDTNRWQESLTETSQQPRSTRNTIVDEHPHQIPHHARMTSPTSCYSRNSGAEDDDEQCGGPATRAPKNTVTIVGRETKRYSITPSKTMSLQGSGEWRRWISNELHGLETSEPATVAQESTSRAISGARPRSSSRRSSYMNERYPIIENLGRPRTALSCHDDHTDNKPGGAPFQVETPEQSSIDAPSRQFTAAQPRHSTSTRARSAFNLKASYKASNGVTARPLEVRRKSQNLLDDLTVRQISDGPYAHASRMNDNKENLPALSSAEWLAAGANKPSRPLSRQSPARPLHKMSTGGSESPAQKLTTEWLDGKRSNANSPMFV